MSNLSSPAILYMWFEMIFILHAHLTTHITCIKILLCILKAFFVIHQQGRVQTHALKHNLVSTYVC